jgi:release factor glutamine methyltransferase
MLRKKFNTTFHYNHLKLKIISGVFHPRFFFSSKYLAAFIEQLELTGKSFCEPCTGSGLISLIAFSKKANVVCFDIDAKAVETVRFNFKHNFKAKDVDTFQIMQSDGFKQVPKQLFDVIAINPPYFFKTVTNEKEYAWNCGENGEFFMDFFKGLQDYLNPQGICYMVLAENCDLTRIEAIAKTNACSFILINEKKIAWEKNFIFEIRLKNAH